MEAGILTWQLYRPLIEKAAQQVKAYEQYDAPDDFLVTLVQGKTIITDETKHEEALSQLEEVRAKQAAETPPIGLAFIRDATQADALSKLSRYETGIERSLYRVLHELQRLQTNRTGGNVLPPSTG